MNNMIVQRDEEGYLVNPDDWTPKIALALAKKEHLLLTSEHWMGINFIREYYVEHGITPDVRHVIKHLAAQQHVDKKVAKAQLFDLYPFGYVKQTCKIAGMKRPRAWSTG